MDLLQSGPKFKALLESACHYVSVSLRHCVTMSLCQCVTVSLSLSPCAGVDRVVLVEDGKVVEQGTYLELLQSGPKFKALLESAGTLESTDEEGSGALTATGSKGDKTQNGEGAGEGGGGGQGGGEAGEGGKTKEEKKGTTLVQKEERETGVVSLAVVWRYISAMGGTSSLVVLMTFYLAIELARLASSTWISVWTGSGGTASGSAWYTGRTANFYLGVYTAICMLQARLLAVYHTVQFCAVEYTSVLFPAKERPRRLHHAGLASRLSLFAALSKTAMFWVLFSSFWKQIWPVHCSQRATGCVHRVTGAAILCFTALKCTVLNCTALNCTELYCTELFRTVLRPYRSLVYTGC